MPRGKHDELLAFLSEKGRGSWAELREAWSWLTGPSQDPADAAWIAARDLAALGHIEIAWDERTTWAAAPPLLTMLPRSGGRALVTGCRPRHLYRPGNEASPPAGVLLETAEELGVWIDECPAPDGPVTLYAACGSSADAEGLAGALGVPYQYEVAEQLARLLPPLDAYARLWAAGELPRGFDAERFDTGEVRWVPVDEPEGPGLYRCATYAGHVHALRGPLGWRRAEREPAVYEALRWAERDVLAYDHSRHELRLPASAALPPLHARAVTLCSGRLPAKRFPRGRPVELIYANVPPHIAEGVASALSQHLGLQPP